MSPEKITAYYMRPEILENIMALSGGREVVPVFGDKGFGSRPSIVQFRADLEYMIRQGATSFHASIERWRNPLVLANNLKKQEIDTLRSGWDMVFDIDAKKSLEHTKIAADLVIRALGKNGIKTATVKFSGRRGFHIGVRAECLPESVNNLSISKSYPDILQKIVGYIKQDIKGALLEELISFDKSLENELKGDPYTLLEIEENWSNRHLFRMPYSLNEKTWLVSVPVDAGDIRKFTPELASPEIVSGKPRFLDTFEKDSALELVTQALEYKPHSEKPEKKRAFEKISERFLDGRGIVQKVKKKGTDTEMRKTYIRLTAEEIETEISASKKSGFRGAGDNKKVTEEFFPPCIKKGMLGISDGRKRFVFILINYLKSSGWSAKEIEDKVIEFNKANPEPLDETLIRGQISYAEKRADKFPPPNCQSAGYYQDIKVCEPDNICAKIKNPLMYAFFKTADNRAKTGAQRRYKMFPQKKNAVPVNKPA